MKLNKYTNYTHSCNTLIYFVSFVLHNVRASQATIFVLYTNGCFRAAVFVFRQNYHRSFSTLYELFSKYFKKKLQNACIVLGKCCTFVLTKQQHYDNSRSKKQP